MQLVIIIGSACQVLRRYILLSHAVAPCVSEPRKLPSLCTVVTRVRERNVGVLSTVRTAAISVGPSALRH